MTVKELSERTGFPLACGDGERQAECLYCGDLLSIVMSRAPAGCVWVTVMGNINSIAVAVLADAACIVVAENMPLDADAKARAAQENIAVLRTSLPVFEAATALAAALRLP